MKLYRIGMSKRDCGTQEGKFGLLKSTSSLQDGGTEVYGAGVTKAELLCPGTSAGYFGLFVKYGQPPGWRYGEWDYRPEWDYFGDKDKTVEIRFDRTSEGFHTGNEPRH